MSPLRSYRVVLGSLAAAALLATAGCATPYQNADLNGRGGYSVSWLSHDTYKVVFRANGGTSSKRIKDFTYLCAAQVSLQHNYPFFEVLGTSNESLTTFVPPYRHFVFYHDDCDHCDDHHDHDSHHHYHHHRSGHWVTDPGYTVTMPGFGLLVKCLEKPADAGDHAGRIYDAEQIQKLLRKKYDIKVDAEDQVDLPTVSPTAGSSDSE